MLSTKYKAALEHFLQPLAMVLVRMGISPTAITVTCPVVVSLLCVMFVRSQAILPFSVGVLIVGSLDGLDGVVARVSGRVSQTGAYLDAMADRYVEAIVALSVAHVTGYWLWTMIVLIGSLLVSYAKARTAMEVRISNQEWPDLMERTERDVLFLLGLAASAIVPWRPLGHDLFWWTLVLLSIFICLTLIQRMRRAHQFILERGARGFPR